MTARERFIKTRKAIIELDTIKAKLIECGEDWQPEQVRVNGILSDPTALQATYNVDVLGDLLENLRQRESELEFFIGETLMIIARVAEGLGKDYAQLLDQRYIDGLEWKDVTINGVGISRQSGKRKLDIAFDWIDSLGVERLRKGDFDL